MIGVLLNVVPWVLVAVCVVGLAIDRHYAMKATAILRRHCAQLRALRIRRDCITDAVRAGCDEEVYERLVRRWERRRERLEAKQRAEILAIPQWARALHGVRP